MNMKRLSKKFIETANKSNIDFCEEDNYIADYLNESKNYLIYFQKYKWDNSSGIEFCKREELQETCVPYYLSSCKLVETTGKILTLLSSHHDKPTGFLAYVVALTNREYNRLKKMDDFWELEEAFEEMLSEK